MNDIHKLRIAPYFDVAMGLQNPNFRLCKKQFIERNKSEYAYIFTFDNNVVLFYWVEISPNHIDQHWCFW